MPDAATECGRFRKIIKGEFQPVRQAADLAEVTIAPTGEGEAAAPRAGGFQAAKESWLKTIARYPNLSGSDVAVAIVIASYLNRDRREAWPSLETIAADCNRNVSTVWRSVLRLEQLKLLEVRRSPSRGRNSVNRYRPLLGELDVDPKDLRRRAKNPANFS